MPHTIYSRAVTAVVEPENGARIVSLRGAGREWLLPSAPSTDRGPCAEYMHEGTGGWDEIAPTIQAYTRDDGSLIPDHGEMWNVPWSILEQTTSALTTQLTLQSMPVTFTRRITATDNGGLLLSYTADTSAIEPMPFLWSAHPLFRVENGSAISLPQDLEPKLLQDYPDERVMSWPRGGAIGALPTGTALKAFAREPRFHSSAALTHPDGSQLILSWDPEMLPYLGLFWDNSHFSAVPTMAIEPTTARGDTPHAAQSRRAIQKISSDAPLKWWIALNIGARDVPDARSFARPGA